MPSRSRTQKSDSLPPILEEAPAAERRLHRQLVLDNVEFVIDALYGELLQQNRAPPSACQTATPAEIARKPRTVDNETCRIGKIQYTHLKQGNKDDCSCGDPLSGSTDPLDSVAAVSLSTDADSPAAYYFKTAERRTVANLRSSIGTWEEISNLEHEQLTAELQEATPRKGISDQRVRRLQSLLEAVNELRYTKGVTLRDFSNTNYEHYAESLSGLPGVNESAAWWLVLTAFDKPVWPSSKLIDGLLCSLGLLAPEEVNKKEPRHKELEHDLTDRLIPVFHRALASHVVRAGTDSCGECCEIRKFLLSHRLRVQQESALRECPTVVDLFAGAGGLSHGLSRAGFDIQWAIDNEPDAVATFRLNHPEVPHRNVVCDDIREIDVAERIRDAVGSPDVIIGGPPCQSLSPAGYRSRLAKNDDYSVLDDERTDLYTQYIKTVDELRPKAIVMENVEGMVSEIGDTGVRVIDSVINGIEELGSGQQGYSWEYRLANLNNLGIPQKRERVIVLAVRNDLVSDADRVVQLFDTIEEGSKEEITVRQGISGLPRLFRGEGGKVVLGSIGGRRSRYVKDNNLDNETDLIFNHQARSHPMEKDQKLFDEALQPGDTGWDVKYRKTGEYADLIEYDVGTEENPRFKDKYRMLRWGEPAPTIVAHLAKDANSFVLPDYYEHVQNDEKKQDNRRNRGITPREAARLQSFPDDFIFLGPFTSWFRQIGNAVPPLAGEQIGKVLKPLVSHETSASVDTDAALIDEAASDD